MSLPILIEQLRYAMANEIAEAATCLAFMQHLALHVKKLHEHVALLAGSRCGEIYALDDEPVAGVKP